MGGSASSAMGAGYQRLGPIHPSGDVRSPHTGSVSTRCPSTSTSVDECPIQVTRSPSSGGVAKRFGSMRSTTTGIRGELSGLEWNRSDSVRSQLFWMGCGFSNPPSCHCGERTIRASRAPSAPLPNARHPSMTTTSKKAPSKSRPHPHRRSSLPPSEGRWAWEGKAVRKAFWRALSAARERPALIPIPGP